MRHRPLSLLPFLLLLGTQAVWGQSPATAPGPTAPVLQTLPDGAQVVVRHDDTPLVAVDVFIKVGVPQEPDAAAGISNLVARTLLASTDDTTPEMMQQAIGNLGGNVSTSWQPEWTQISALAVPDQFSDAVFLETNVLKRATFDEDAVDSTRTQLESEFDQRDADLFQAAYQGIRSALYPDTGWGRPSGGTLATISQLTRTDLIRFYDRWYIPSNFLFVVEGDVDPQKAVQLITSDMSDFPDSRLRRVSTSPPAVPPMPDQLPTPVRVVQPDLNEAAVMVGYRVPPASSPEYPAAQVVNALLGGMKTSRLFTNLREKQGLAYELGSSLNGQIYTGDLVGFVFAPPLRTDPTTHKGYSTIGLLKDQLLSQFDSFKATPPTPVELARAQHFLVGSYLIKHERLEDRATYLGTSVLTTGGTDFDTDYAKYIDAVTLNDLTQFADRYFRYPAISTIAPDAAALKADEVSGP